MFEQTIGVISERSLAERETTQPRGGSPILPIWRDKFHGVTPISQWACLVCGED
jgi:hypothetical protein